MAERLYMSSNTSLPRSQIAYILAGLTAGGGTIGFLRAGSVPSMVAGCGVGALYGQYPYHHSPAVLPLFFSNDT